MALPLAQSAIAFLIDLAEQGEIDPWDVKVIDVIDRFLSTLQDQPSDRPVSGRTAYEASLSESGQAFLYAAMLVLLKADTLVRTEVEEIEEDFAEDFLESEDLAAAPLPRHLERQLRRRAVAAPPVKRQVTLNELIEQLELIATVLEANPTRLRKRRPQTQSKRQAVRAIAQLAHQENLSEIAAALEEFLDAYWDELEEALEWIEFEQLIELWPKFRPDSLEQHAFESPEQAHKHEKVGVFWGLLFLSSQSKVEMHQQTFYQDLLVRNLNKMPLADLSDLPSYVLPD
ncbi:MAG: segregation/condensation protein A [Leptolyngbyaceae cyanobacterium SL_1_1]|nr:segregation/condensation protein A [Leptolyngbyaceae cyanobacterium RM2_2_21]NJN04214.1 segregation/condensation protein A [Leptolyngbyaceae cyanobacterium RM1_1_2]NJO08343.1 segregation/condensation protein A [Leptolyngbyaceae cyanobacterium SL_1_1]